MVEVRRLPGGKLADFFEAEPKSLAAQDQFEPGTVTLGKQSFLPFTDWAQQLLRLIEPKSTRRYIIRIAHLSDGHGFFRHLFHLSQLLRSCVCTGNVNFQFMLQVYITFT
jgi:hypothetical protein